eukprot:403359033
MSATLFLAGMLFEQAIIRRKTELLSRKYSLIFTSFFTTMIYIVLMNIENKLIFLLSLFALGIMFNSQDHMGSHLIYDNVPSDKLDTYHNILSVLKALSPFFIVIAFWYFEMTVIEMLYYLLLLQLICMFIHIALPDEEGGFTTVFHETTLEGYQLHKEDEKKVKNEEVKKFLASHKNQKSVLQTIQQNRELQFQFIFVALIISAVHMCNVGLNFGMNNMIGSLYLNTFIVSLADITALIWQHMQQKKYKETFIYQVASFYALGALTVTLILILLPYLSHDEQYDKNNYLIAVLVFHLKLFLDLKFDWVEGQGKKLFESKDQYFRAMYSIDNIQRLSCLLIPVFSQMRYELMVPTIMMILTVFTFGYSTFTYFRSID